MAAPIVTRLVLNTRGFAAGASKAASALKPLASGLGSLAGLATKVTLAFTALTAATTAIIVRQTAFVARLVDTSNKLGINIEFLQKFRYAAEQSGISVETADMALQRFTRRVAEAARGTGEARGALAQLGIATKDASGNLRPMEEILFDVADGIANTTDEAERVRLAFKFFDSEGVSLVNTLREGGDALEEMFGRAQALGGILRNEAAEGVKEFDNTLKDLQTLIGGITNQLVAALAPALREVTNEFIEFVKQLGAEQGGFENLGKFLKDEFINILVTTIRVFETITNIVIALTNAIIGLARAAGVTGLPELSEDAKKAAESLEALNDAVKTPTGTIGIDTGQIIKDLEALGYDVQRFADRYEELGVLGKLFGTGEEYQALRTDLLAFVDTLVKDLEAKTGTFGQVDFTSLIEMLLGHTEEAKEKAREATEAVMEEVVVVGQKMKPRLLDIILDALFPVEQVDKFFETYEDEAASTADKVRAFFELVGESIEKALPNLREKFEQSGVGDFVKTLEDGLVKAGQMLEDSLADAIITGKADFTALGEHIKKVLAKALIQKFITAPIMGIFGLAKGGTAKGGQPYIVGEEGPELFVPGQTGTVVPNDQLRGGGGMGAATAVTYNINAVDARSFKQLVAQDPEFLFNVTQAGARRVPT